MNYEEELMRICQRKEQREVFVENKGIREIKNSIKKLAIQNENINQDYMDEIYKISLGLESINNYIKEKTDEDEKRNKRISRELEIREKRFVKSIISILDNIKYIYDFSLKSNNEVLNEAMLRLFNIVKKTIINVDILIIDGKENFFDENLHECVGTIWDKDRQDYEITEVLKLGYIYKGKVEREAQVVVVKNKEDMKWEE
ncbi:nucleotide exchange factor GrpE [Clostridium sp. B9]|uniref:nucleotide exchange factor GrpE n=1 Tax=Clostridium sp. B9 TaxID=3423224 RepID=UPI003D2EEF20